MLANALIAATQAMREGAWSYMTDFWNAVDVSAEVLTLVAVMHIGNTDIWCAYREYECMSTARAWQASALLLTWYKILYFMRGFEYTAFVVNMLNQIVVDMGNFLIVLFIILVA